MNTQEIIQRIVQQGTAPVGCVACTVTAVDKTARTCDCDPLNEDAPILGVNLQANQQAKFGVVQFPRVGSFVVVGFLSDGMAGAVLLTDDVESVEVVISEDTARAVLDEQGVRINMADSISVELNSDGIIMNGGELGGLVKVEDVTTRLNIIEKDINALKKALTGWTPVPQDGGSALKAGVNSWAGKSLQLSKRGDYENEKVKQ